MRRREKYKVNVFPIREILKEIKFEGTAKDFVGRFIQMVALQLDKEHFIIVL